MNAEDRLCGACGHREHFHLRDRCMALHCACDGFLAPVSRLDPSVVAPTAHRREGPDTSIIASHRSAPAAATQRGVLLRLFHDAGAHGLTALEAQALLRQHFPRLRSVYPRLIELKDSGWVLVQDRTRDTDSGSPAHVNVFDPEAEDEYQAWMARERRRHA